MAFVIKEHRPGKWRLVSGIVVIVWVASAWFAYQYGWNQSNHNQQQAASVQEMLQGELKGLRISNSKLQAQVSGLQRSAQVDRQAKVELAVEIKNFQDLQAELREEISFYKSIISPDKGEMGLKVYSLAIVPAEDRLHHFKLVLTQGGKGDNVAKGRVKMLLKGTLQGKEKSLGFSKIQVAESPQLSYKFRYFQELSGSFSLPEGYSPREVTVRMVPNSGKNSNKPVRTFDWQTVRR